MKATDGGYTRIDAAGRPMDVATGWKNLDGYVDWLVDRFAGNPR